MLLTGQRVFRFELDLPGVCVILDDNGRASAVGDDGFRVVCI